ncbi:uncharacterized protein T551_00121 [Pneumocystis jirovecii RU7]|uniref:Uncharacterized protein n=1 Tax=Pneumocystis jirovecii (strain RU7) TaxID=1408657 RepID=A0A0W4ZWA5_PNEJ7|nr:uncharacterized protein T551_00121 [Pneumocystis jirovecii RU7]KTW32636.1 hypothetical protein T551_00121 [Pneumocystis jirovecii RU7]
MSMNEYKNGTILTIAIYKLGLRRSFLSIMNSLFLFMPLTLIFPQKFKFLTRYLYSCIKNQKDIIKVNNDFPEENQSEIIHSNGSFLLNHLHTIQKAFQMKPKLYNSRHKNKYKKKYILSTKTDLPFLTKNNYFFVYDSLSNKKQCLIKYPYAKKPYLQSFSDVDFSLYIFCEPFLFKKDILALNIKINELLKLIKHNSFDISILHYTSDNEVKELKEVRILLRNTEKNSKNRIKTLKEVKISPKSNQNMNKIIKIYESVSISQNNFTSFYNSFNFNFPNSGKKTFKYQFIYHSPKNSLKTFPMIANHSNFSQRNTFSKYKQRSYEKLPSKRNTSHPLSDIQNSCSKFLSTPLYNPSFNMTKTFKDKQFDIHTHLKENVCPTAQSSTQGFAKDNISIKIASDTSNAFENEAAHFTLPAHEKKLMFKEQHNQEGQIFDNHVSIDMIFSNSKTNSTKTHDKKKSLKDIKRSSVNIVDLDIMLPLLESSTIPSRTSKYKQPKIFSPIKINNIYEDSLRLLKQIHDDNRRRGIPPCPPPIQKRWEFVEY